MSNKATGATATRPVSTHLAQEERDILRLPGRMLYQLVGRRQYERDVTRVRAGVDLPRQRRP